MTTFLHILKYKGKLFYFSDIAKLQIAKGQMRGSEMAKSEPLNPSPSQMRKATK